MPSCTVWPWARGTTRSPRKDQAARFPHPPLPPRRPPHRRRDGGLPETRAGVGVPFLSWTATRSSPIVALLFRASSRCALSRRDSLRPSPPTPRTSPARADLVIRARFNVPTGSTRRVRRPRSRRCRAVPRGAVLLRARGLPHPSGLAQVPRSPPAPTWPTPFPRHRTPTRPSCICSAP